MSNRDKFHGQLTKNEIIATGTIAALTVSQQAINKLPLVQVKFDNGHSVSNLEVQDELVGMSLEAHFDMTDVAIAANTTLRVELQLFDSDEEDGTYTRVQLSDVYGSCVAPDCVDLANNVINLDFVVEDAQADGVKNAAKCQIDLLRKFNKYLRFKAAPESLDGAGADAGLTGGVVVVLAELSGGRKPSDEVVRPAPALTALP